MGPLHPGGHSSLHGAAAPGAAPHTTLSDGIERCCMVRGGSSGQGPSNGNRAADGLRGPEGP